MVKTLRDKEYGNIIKALKRARIVANLRQTEVAEKLGKPQSYISKIESGERRLDVAELKKFAKIYGKPASYFL